MTFIAIGWNLLIALGLPIGFFLYFAIKKRSYLLPFSVGVATFLFSQILTRIPLLTFLGSQSWYVAFKINSPAFYSILLGLSAGIFEEIGRFIAMTLMRRHRGYYHALAFGLGHGGFEAFALVGINYLVILLTNPSLVTSSPAGMISLAGFERLFAMTLHLAFSIMVMRAVEQKKPLWLVAAILIHSALDAGLGLLQLAGIGILGIEVYVAMFSLAALIFILFSRPKAGPVPALAASQPYASQTTPSQQDQTPNQL